MTISTDVTILAHDSSTSDYVHKTKVERVDIGNSVFIGCGSTILPGVKIGNNVIVGGGSVVSRDIPDNVIVAGNPAKHLRKRFDEELIGLLLKFKWWDKSVEEINSMIPILTCSDLSKVKAELEKRLNADSDDYEDIHDPCLRFQR